MASEIGDRRQTAPHTAPQPQTPHRTAMHHETVSRFTVLIERVAALARWLGWVPTGAATPLPACACSLRA